MVKQSLLEMDDLKKRIVRLNELLTSEIDVRILITPINYSSKSRKPTQTLKNQATRAH